LVRVNYGKADWFLRAAKTEFGEIPALRKRLYYEVSMLVGSGILD